MMVCRLPRCAFLLFLGVCAVLTVVAVPPAQGADPPAAAKARRKPSAKAGETARGPATPPPDSSALADLRKSNVALKKLLSKQPPSWSPENDARNSEVRKMVDQFLDFEELSRRALSRHWDGLSGKQRTEFVATLHDLIDRNYLRQIHGKPDYDLKFDKETRTGNESAVHATLTTTTSKGKKVTVDLEYRTVYKNGRWVVYDIVTDDASLLENYRAEFNKIIEKDGFETLLSKLRRKLKEKSE
jgi:phospholipid transport system substrate-binding protein